MRIGFYNTITDTYKEKQFNLLPYITLCKYPSWADFYAYVLQIGWLCWCIQIEIYDESADYGS